MSEVLPPYIILVALLLMPPALGLRWILARIARAKGVRFGRMVAGGLTALSIALVTSWAVVENSAVGSDASLRRAFALLGLAGLLLFCMSTLNFLKFPDVREDAPPALVRARRVATREVEGIKRLEAYEKVESAAFFKLAGVLGVSTAEAQEIMDEVRASVGPSYPTDDPTWLSWYLDCSCGATTTFPFLERPPKVVCSECGKLHSTKSLGFRAQSSPEHAARVALLSERAPKKPAPAKRKKS